MITLKYKLKVLLLRFTKIGLFSFNSLFHYYLHLPFLRCFPGQDPPALHKAGLGGTLGQVLVVGWCSPVVPALEQARRDGRAPFLLFSGAGP